MTTATRRAVIRVCLAVDILGAVALVIGAATRSTGNWSGTFTAVAFLAASLVAGLLYLRSTRGRS